MTNNSNELQPLDLSYLEKVSLETMFNRYLALDAPDVECGLHALHVKDLTKILID